MTFDERFLVSQNLKPDQLAVTFNNPEYFVTLDGHWPIPQDYYLESPIPRLIDPADEDFLQRIGVATEIGMNLAMGIPLLTSMISSVGLSRVWMMVNTHDLISNEPKMAVITPANALTFNSYVFSSVNLSSLQKNDAFDSVEQYLGGSSTSSNSSDSRRALVSQDGFRDEYLDFTGEDYLSENRAVKQTSTFLFFAVGFLLLILLVWALKLLLGLCKAGRNFYTYCMGKLVFNSILRCLIQCFFSICLAVFSNVHVMS